ncbi:MAG: hypothetical protein FWG75_05610 [Cystobacterineae bacterium]|nr:hypothetical protein [Cystobacterineae bacterium]
MAYKALAKLSQLWQPVRMRCLWLLFFALAFSVLFSGCKGSCRKLSEKLCECESYKPARDYCRQRAADRESLYSPTGEENARCKLLLESCDCNVVDTAEGKIACGLARP